MNVVVAHGVDFFPHSLEVTLFPEVPLVISNLHSKQHHENEETDHEVEMKSNHSDLIQHILVIVSDAEKERMVGGFSQGSEEVIHL